MHYTGIILVANKVDLAIICKFTQTWLSLSSATDHHFKKKKKLYMNFHQCTGIALVANKVDLAIKCKFTQTELTLLSANDHHFFKKADE